MRKLAAGGGHSAALTDACSLKELCELRLADTVTVTNASKIEDIALRIGSDALAHICERLRYSFYHGQIGAKVSFLLKYTLIFFTIISMLVLNKFMHVM